MRRCSARRNSCCLLLFIIRHISIFPPLLPFASNGNHWKSCCGTFIFLIITEAICWRSAPLIRLLRDPSYELWHYWSYAICQSGTVCPASHMSEVVKRESSLILQKVCSVLGTFPHCFWLKAFLVLDFFCVFFLKTHISHIFSISLEAWKVWPEHVIEYWIIHSA